MKKIFFGFLFNSFLLVSFGQSFDDGLVSSRLPVNSADEKYTTFATSFHQGLEKVKNGELTSFEAVDAYYGINSSGITKFDQLVSNASTNANPKNLSYNFLAKVKSAIDYAGVETSTIQGFRNELVKITSRTPLNADEVEFLLKLDIATQEINRGFPVNEISFQPNFLNDNDTYDNTGISLNLKGTTGINKMDMFSNPVTLKLGAAIRCALGVIGSALTGGLAGIFGGAQVGGLLGGVVGGILGTIAGTFTGAASYCNIFSKQALSI